MWFLIPIIVAGVAAAAAAMQSDDSSPSDEERERENARNRAAAAEKARREEQAAACETLRQDIVRDATGQLQALLAAHSEIFQGGSSGPERISFSLFSTWLDLPCETPTDTAEHLTEIFPGTTLTPTWQERDKRVKTLEQEILALKQLRQRYLEELA